MASASIGSALTERREKLGLDKGQAADKIGMSRTTYSSYELDAQRPSVDVFPALAGFLDIDIEALLVLYGATSVAVVRPSLERLLEAYGGSESSGDSSDDDSGGGDDERATSEVTSASAPAPASALAASPATDRAASPDPTPPGSSTITLEVIEASEGEEMSYDGPDGDAAGDVEEETLEDEGDEDQDEDVDEDEDDEEDEEGELEASKPSSAGGGENSSTVSSLILVMDEARKKEKKDKKKKKKGKKKK